MQEVVIVSAVRTPIGKFNGAFADISPVELGTLTTIEALKRSGISPDEVDQVILGNVLQAGLGQNIARQILVHAGISFTKPAMTINEVCGSGLKAVILGKQAIQLGESDVVVVGGVESMSQAPYLLPRALKDEAIEENLIDSMIHDGLTDIFTKKHMGITAENVAEKYHISREAQDRFALESQMKAAEATRSGKFANEIVPVVLKDGTVLAHDEGIRGNSTLEKLSTLRTVFKENGTVTAGNASTINDGASVLILMSKEKADNENIPYLAVLGSYVEIGNEPDYMGYAPYYAIKNLLKKTGKTVSDIDLYEINEAFASQSLAVMQDLNLPHERTNIHGGAIALGHPIGASGARILTSLVHQLNDYDKQTGIASLCVGGGIGLALMIHRD